MRVGAEEEFLALLRELVASFPRRYRGLVRHEVLVDEIDSRRVQYVSVWSDEAALVAYAGEEWRSSPVTFPDEERFLTGPLELRHFASVPLDAASGDGRHREDDGS